MKPLSFVIITYNRPEDALALAMNISQLEELDELVEEVIIVNNRSSVSYRPLEEFIDAYPDVPFRYFVTEENLGVSRGRNYAIQQSKAPILVFLDDDALIQNSHALLDIDMLFAGEPAIGIAAFKVYITARGRCRSTPSRTNGLTKEKTGPSLIRIISLAVRMPSGGQYLK